MSNLPIATIVRDDKTREEALFLVNGEAMFSRSAAEFSLCLALAFVCLLGTKPCEAQQSDRSLFVIKTPNVKHSSYGQQPRGIVFAPVSHPQEQSTTPREDDGSDEKDDAKMEEVDDYEKLVEDDDLLFDEDDDDDADSQPPEVPITRWNLKPMSSITPGLTPVSGKSPADLSWQLTSRSSMPIANSDKLFAWAAPDFSYNPLYFEDVALERYGQTRGLIRQPFVSGFHYLKSAVFLPYYTLFDPIDSCDGPLGYCRPGERIGCVTTRDYFGCPFGGRKCGRTNCCGN